MPLAALRGHYPDELLRAADAASYGTEFLSYRMSIRTVGSFDEALEHIARYSSQHSEAIVAEDPQTIRRYQREVDAACVYANVSTAFTDGAQFGMGAEIFTTGRGTPYSLAAAPVLKICSRSEVKENWPDLIDINAGPISSGEKTIAEVGTELFLLLLDVVSGRKQSFAEGHGLANDLCIFNPAPIT